MKIKVYYTMCDNEGGGSWGNVQLGYYTQEEINQGKHRELIKTATLSDGCYWSLTINNG